MTNSLRLGVSALATIGAVGLGLFAGCSSSSDTPADGPEAGAEVGGDATPDVKPETVAETTPETAGDASETAVDGDAASEAETAPADTKAHLRIAQLSIDADLSDFCVVPVASATATGDFTTAIPQAKAASLPGVPYATVTAYNALPPGFYAVRIVAGGAADCKTGLADYVSAASWAAGSFHTVASYGLKSATDSTKLAITGLVDSTTPVAGKVDARIFYALPVVAVPSVDVGGYLGASPTIIWHGLPYGSAKPTSITTGTSEANDYVSVPALGSKPLGVFATTTTTPLPGAKVTAPLAANTLLSVFVIPKDATTAQILACDDTVTPIASATTFTSKCSALPVAVDPAPDAGTD